jgi:very-short-patch-repair endonuclease
MSVKQARRLRKNATPAEKKLWSCLRNRRVAGFKFRRQCSVRSRILDFYCEEARLAIELDGSGHKSHLGQCRDLDRDIELYEGGIRVLRFDNSAVLRNVDGVISEIISAVAPEQFLPVVRGKA